MKNPIQPLALDEHGVLRFKANKLVEHLLDKGGLTLNDLALVDASQDDREQLAQLIGYSHDGFGSLSYVSEETFATAAAMYESSKSESAAKIEYLESLVADLRRLLREPIATLYGIHPDDLQENP